MWKVGAARVLPIALSASVMAGCAMKGDVRDLQSDIRALAARQDSLLTELRAAMMSTQDTVRTQSDQMFDFRGELNRQLREMNQALRTLQALAGENQRTIAGIRDQMASQRGGPAIPPQVVVSDSAGAAGSGGERLIAGASDPEQLMRTGLDLMDRGSLAAASRAFEEFLRNHPNDERAVDARFYLADILDQQDRDEDALAAFQEIQTLFPTAPRVPDAMIRVARLQRDMGNIEEARTTLQRIVNTYPNTSAALLARDMLEEIGSWPAADGAGP
jgi:tol-pal system protein YbgF